MHIRSARVDDALGMAHVIVDTFLLANEGIMPGETMARRRQEWTYEVSARAWEENLHELNEGRAPRECIYVAVEKGADAEADEVVGLAYGCPSASSDTIGEVSALYVRADHQGQGIGRALVQTVAVHLAQLGMTALHIAALEAGPTARRFYESIGGQVVGTRQHNEYGVLLPLVVYGWPDTQTLIDDALDTLMRP